MAKKTFWLIGKGGSGKTTMAVALAASYSRRPGIVCALQTSFGMVCRYDAGTGAFADDAHVPVLLDSADFLFVEIDSPRHFDPAATRTGDVVVRLERVSLPGWEGNPRLGGWLADPKPNTPPALTGQAPAAINSDAAQESAHA